MPTTTRKPQSRTKAAASTDGESRAASALQQTLEDLDKLRGASGEDLRRQLEAARKRIRDVAGDLRERTDERTATVEKAVSRVADDAWQQLATVAIRGLRDPDALTELSTEIRKRKAQLRPPAKRAAAKKAG
jgi:hypothetical protein